MVQRSRGKGEDLPDVAALLRVLRDSRQAIIAAQSRVRAFGTTYHALAMVKSSIDALAIYLTGNPIYFDDPANRTPESGIKPDPFARR